MQTAAANLLETPVFEAFDPKPVFKILIAYEDFAAGKHAKETYNFLVRQLESEFQFENQMWNFDLLRNVNLRAMAARDALTADLIIISSRGQGEVPFGVKAWLETWSVGDCKALALVNLVDRPVDQKAPPSAMRRYLQRIAKCKDIGFFGQPDEWPESEGVPENLQPRHKASQMSVLMANLIQDQSTAWRVAINN